MDDKIIYSWCFKFVECFDSISSIVIIFLFKLSRAFQALDPNMVIECGRGGYEQQWIPRAHAFEEENIQHKINHVYKDKP